MPNANTIQTDRPTALMLSPREAAAIAGTSTRTITRLCLSGEIPACKLRGSWRIPRAAFGELLGIQL